MAKILRCVLGLVKIVVLGVSIDGDAMVLRTRPHRRVQMRCPVCGRRCESFPSSRNARVLVGEHALCVNALRKAEVQE